MEIAVIQNKIYEIRGQRVMPGSLFTAVQFAAANTWPIFCISRPISCSERFINGLKTK